MTSVNDKQAALLDELLKDYTDPQAMLGEHRKAEDAADSHGYSAACQKRCHNTCGYFTPERHASLQGFTLLAGTGQIWRIDTPLAALNSSLG